MSLAATGHQRAYGLTEERSVDSLTHRDDFPRHLEPHDRWSACRRWVRALALKHVGAVYARSGYTDQYFTDGRPGDRAFNGDQNFRTAGAGRVDRDHGIRNVHVAKYQTLLRH